MSFLADLGPSEESLRRGLSENENDFTYSDLEGFVRIGHLVGECLQNPFKFLDALGHIDENAGGGDAYVNEGVIPEGAKEGFQATATDDVGGKVEDLRGGRRAGFAESFFQAC